MPNEDVVALLAGLGNQLFQVAFGQWLETRTGRELGYDVSFHRAGEPDAPQISGIGDNARARLLRGTRRWPTADGRVAPLGRAIRRLRGPRRIVSDYSSPGPEHPAIDAGAWCFGYWQRLEYAQPVVGRLAEALELEDAEAGGARRGSRPPQGHAHEGDRRARGVVRRGARPASAGSPGGPRPGLVGRSGVVSSRASTSAGRSRSPTTGPRCGTCGKWLSAPPC